MGREEEAKKVSSLLDSAVTEILDSQRDLDRATRRAASAQQRHAELLIKLTKMAAAAPSEDSPQARKEGA